MQPMPMYSIRVRSAQTVTEGGSTYTLYAFEVFSRTSTSWIQLRRYRELHKFNASIQKYINPSQAPPFPPRHFMGKNSADVIQERKEQLEIFFAEVIALASSMPRLRRRLHRFMHADEMSRYAFTNDVEMMSLFIDVEGHNPSDPDDLLATPLHYAAAQGHEDMVALLLQRGCDVLHEDLFGNTPLSLANQLGHNKAIYNQLLAHVPEDQVEKAQQARGVYIPPQYVMHPEDRRVLVLVNPFSGRKKAVDVFENVVGPLLQMCGIRAKVVFTTHAGHASEVVSNENLDLVDTIMCVSGDGLMFEVVNGLANRNDAAQALRMPLAIVPAGSGNGLACSLGMPTPVQAVLRFLRGKYRPLDLLEVEQDGAAPLFGFLYLSWGVLADVDFQSESVRWMGEARFTWTALKKIMAKKEYRAVISYELADSDFVRCNHNVRGECRRCSWGAQKQKRLVQEQIAELARGQVDDDNDLNDDEDGGDDDGDDDAKQDEEDEEEAEASVGVGVDKADASLNGGDSVEDENAATAVDASRNGVEALPNGHGGPDAHVGGSSGAGVDADPADAHSDGADSADGTHGTDGTDGTDGADGAGDTVHEPPAKKKVSSARPAVVMEANIFDSFVYHLPRVEGAYPMLNKPGWFVLEDNLQYMVVANLSMLTSDIISAPFTHFSDGCLDLVIARGLARTGMLKLFMNTDKEDFVLHPSISMVKCKSLVIDPITEDTSFDVDGEFVENRKLSIRVRPAAATIMW